MEQVLFLLNIKWESNKFKLLNYNQLLIIINRINL